MKKSIRILALLLAVLLLTGCGASSKTYTCGELSMEVPAGTKDVSDNSAVSAYTFALEGSDFAIFGLNETFADYPELEAFDTRDYADQVILVYGLDSDVCQRFSSNYHYIVYTAETGMGEFTYMAGIYRTDAGFWMVQVAAPSDQYDEQECFRYLDSVSFS